MPNSAASTRSLTPCKETEQLPEHPPVGGRVRLQDDAAGLPGPGLLQRHPGGHSEGGRGAVHHQGPGLAAVNDQDRLARQVGLLAQFHLGPQVRDQHTGNPQDASPTGQSAWSGDSVRPRSVRTRPRAMPGRRVRYSPSSSRRSWRSATEALLIPQPLASSRNRGRVGIAGREIPQEGQQPDLFLAQPRGQLAPAALSAVATRTPGYGLRFDFQRASDLQDASSVREWSPGLTGWQ